MTKECVDEYLAKNEKIAQDIKRIAERYLISDFVKVTKPIQEYLQDNEYMKVERINGCLCNIRKRHLRLDMDSVESRLMKEYLEYIMNILTTKEDIDKVFYIVAYHYLTMLKQLGYQLTSAKEAPFPFWGNEMSPLAKKNYKCLQEIMDGRLDYVISYFSEEDLQLYNNAYRECGDSYHATKHFSLIEHIVGFVQVVDKYNFDYELTKVLDVFVLNYRAIFTNKRLHMYMYKEEREEVVRELVDMEVQA